jgi:streptogramin lyase
MLHDRSRLYLSTLQGDFGGELGHVPINFDGRACICGGQGCLKVYVSGTDIALMGTERLKRNVSSVDVFNTAPSAPQALAVDKGGMVWMGAQYEIMRLNPLTRKLVRYVNYPFPTYVFPSGGPAPNAFFSNFGTKVGSKGRILYTGSSTSYVGWLDPGQSTVTEFRVPTPMALPLGMAPSSDFWFTEVLGNNISVLEAPPGAASRPVTATTWTIPRSTGTAPVRRFQLRRRDNVVAPQTGVTVGTVTGPFEEFPLPTPDSRPCDIAVSKTGVFFTEQLMPPPPLSGSPPVGGNKIGLLQP